jgi:CHRD domain
MPVVAVRRLLALLAVAVAVAALSAAPTGAQTSAPAKCTAIAVLRAGNEVPPTTSQASGVALVHINGTRLRFTTVIANPARETFILGHIHRGVAGVNGPIVVPLFEGSSDSRLFTQFESRDIAAALAGEICGNTAGFYVNYHTTAFPGGAIRGQLTKLF